MYANSYRQHFREGYRLLVPTTTVSENGMASKAGLSYSSIISLLRRNRAESRQ